MAAHMLPALFLLDPSSLLAHHPGLATGLQIVAVGCGLLGQGLLVLKLRSAFGVWIVSNAALILLNAALHLWGLVAMYAVYTSLCVLSLWTWGRGRSGLRAGGEGTLDLTALLTTASRGTRQG